MAKELWCNECGIGLGDPIQSNIDAHTKQTGHSDMIDREKVLDDGTLASNPGQLPTEHEPPREAEKMNKLQEMKATIKDTFSTDNDSSNGKRKYNKRR